MRVKMLNHQVGRRDAIPVTIIAGHLGAGKTTLVNHVLAQSRDRRLAVIVNDFGSTDLDPELLGPGGTVTLADGCICCARSTELVLALAGLRSRRLPPDQILIEASGMSNPRRIAESVGLGGLRLDGTVVVVDAEAVRTHALDRIIGAPLRQQLLAADLIVLNKVDQVTEMEKNAVCDWISELVPAARLVETSHGRVHLPLVLSQEREEPAWPASPSSVTLAEPILGDPEYGSWACGFDDPLDGAAVRWWAANLPDGILRGTGVLFLEEDPLHRYDFHLVGSRWTLERDTLWGREPPRSRMVLIGRSLTLNHRWLDMTIGRCVVHHAHVGTSA